MSLEIERRRKIPKMKCYTRLLTNGVIKCKAIPFLCLFFIGACATLHKVVAYVFTLIDSKEETNAKKSRIINGCEKRIIGSEKKQKPINR